MPLQNRVDPFGQIYAVAARGTFTGNRGVIHDPDTTALLKRRWTTKAWIVCDCDFRGRKREVFGRNAPSGRAGWTNLFFLDEVTALAAGHRPCFVCRRERARDFLDCFGKAFGIARPKVAEIDARLHRERLASGGKAVTILPQEVKALPDGVMVADGDRIYAKNSGKWSRWGFHGFHKPLVAEGLRTSSVVLITPTTTLTVLQFGYRPIWHASAHILS